MQHLLPPVIAFCGFKGSGKSTAAAAISRLGYVRHALAAPIKAALEAFGVPRDFINDPVKKETPMTLLGGKTPRHAMQTLGTEWGRTCIDDEFWLRVWNATRPRDLVCVDDLRFPNEAQFLRQHGALIYRIERAGHEGDDHPSESAHLDVQVDGVFRNGDHVTMDAFRDVICKVVKDAAA